MTFRGGGVRQLARGSGGGGRLTPPSSDFVPVPPERRARTVRRIVAFFRPYTIQVLVVFFAIIATSLIGLVNPLLLKLLIENKNQVVTREKILQSVWGYKVYPNTRTIDNFILNFRKYFEGDSRNPKHFHSVRGVGYKYTD